MASHNRKFSEAEYYSAYKTIRNKFRKFTPESIFFESINFLYRKEKDNVTQLRKNPWLLMLLIKWVYLDEQCTLPGKRNITPHELNGLLQAMINLGGKARLPTEYDHYILFFRNIAYQQFLYQVEINPNSLARQNILFSTLDENHAFKKDFLSKTSLEVNTFIFLSYLTISQFIARSNLYITVDWFSPIYSKYSRETVAKFIECISVSDDSLGSKLAELNQGNFKSYEYYEQTPFLKCPLIGFHNRYFCVYPNILFRNLEHFIYDTLRNENPSRFVNKFGPVFEKYVEYIIKQSNLDYFNENTLKRNLTGKGKLIDFIINDNNSNVFIDAKAVEMSYQGKTAFSSEVLKDRTKTSILKAIEQACEVNERLSKNNGAINKTENNYLIVVTFKELYIGNGKTLYNAVAREKIDEIKRRYKDNFIPIENMYFLTIDEFDIFLENIRLKRINLIDSLNTAIELDSEPATTQFDFSLHLRNWECLPKPTHLLAITDEVYSEIEKAFAAK